MPKMKILNTMVQKLLTCLLSSTELATLDDEERKAELIEAVRNGSVITWKHINLHGE